MITIKIGFTVAILLIQDVSPITVFMKSAVRFQLGDENATIPCSFNRTNTTALLNILWESSTILGQRVLERDTSGAVFTGQHFKETASFGEGCTLVLQNPKPKDSGTYWVTVTVVGEGEDIKAVKLVINSKRNDKTTGKPIILDQTPVTENSTTLGSGHGAEQTHFNLGFILAIVLLGVLLIAVCYISYRWYFSGENKKRPSII